MTYCYQTKNKQYRIVLEDLATHCNVQSKHNHWTVMIISVSGQAASTQDEPFDLKREAVSWIKKHYGEVKSIKTVNEFTENWKEWNGFNHHTEHSFPGLDQ